MAARAMAITRRCAGQEAPCGRVASRVPFLASWPGRIPAAWKFRLMSLSVRPRFTADVCGCLGCGHAAGTSSPDGFDMLPILCGEKVAAHRKCSGSIGAIAPHAWGQWKWVDSALGGGLFDLAGDIGESKDLSKEKPEELLARVKTRFESGVPEMDAAEPRGLFRDYYKPGRAAVGGVDLRRQATSWRPGWPPYIACLLDTTRAPTTPDTNAPRHDSLHFFSTSATSCSSSTSRIALQEVPRSRRKWTTRWKCDGAYRPGQTGLRGWAARSGGVPARGPSMCCVTADRGRIRPRRGRTSLHGPMSRWWLLGGKSCTGASRSTC